MNLLTLITNNMIDQIIEYVRISKTSAFIMWLLLWVITTLFTGLFFLIFFVLYHI